MSDLVQINLGADSVYYTSGASNRKTGDMPSQYIGATRQESLSTCTGCPLLANKECYAQFGSPALGHASIIRTAQKSGRDRYDIDTALQNVSEHANYMRFGAIGDPSAIKPEVFIEHEDKARSAGLGVICYTHHWRQPFAEHLKERSLASCDTEADVAEALGAGWKRTTLYTEDDAIHDKPQGTLDNGARYFLCPAQRGTKKKVECNDCGLCDVKKESKYNVIVFAKHGQVYNARKKREAKNEGE